MEQNSNTAKKPDFKMPSNLIRTGKFLQLFSTATAAKFALKVFATPPKFKTPEREEMMRKSAKNIPVKVPDFEHEVMVYEYGFSKTKVLLCHGWMGRGTQLYAIADKLLENGMMVITFDGIAHGQSGGKTTNLVENIAVTKHIVEKFGPFDAAIGHSFGGITLLNLQAQQPSFNRLVVVGVEHATDKIFDDFIQKLGLKQKVSEGMKSIAKERFGINVSDLNADVAARKIDIPTYIIHDSEDNDIDVSAAYKLRQNLQNGLLLVTKGLGHRRILRDAKVIQRIIDFIKK